MIKKSKQIIFLILVTMISTPILTTAVDINSNTESIPIVKGTENKLEEEFNQLKEEVKARELVDKLGRLLEKVEESEIIFAKKHSLISEIERYIGEVEKEIESDKLSGINKILTEGIKFEILEGKPYIIFPDIDSKYEITCSIINKDNKKRIETGKIKENKLELPKLQVKTNLEIAISVMNIETNKEELSLLVERVFEDQEGPVLNYMYIKDGLVHIDYEDNYMLPKEAAKFKKDDEEDFTNIVDKKFKIHIPGKIKLVLTDIFNNEEEYILEIQSDDRPIYGSVPGPILQELLKDEFIIYEKGDNLLIGEKNKELNIKQVFSELIKENLEVEGLDGIAIDSNKERIIRLDQLGLKEIVVSNKMGKKLKIYVYVVDSINDLSSKVKNIKEKIDDNKILVTNEREINLLQHLDIEHINKETDISNLFVKEHGNRMLHPINEVTNLNKNSNNRIEIIDILDDKSYGLNIINNTKANTTTSIDKEKARFDAKGEVPKVEFKQYYLDVDEEHWASNAITRLTDSGVLRGYDNRKFLPNDNMTMKEFLVMFGRFVNLQDPAILNPSIKDRSMIFEYWGQAEANNVITRIDPQVLKRLDTSDFSRNIRKEEVAFLIAHTIILDTDTSIGANLNDISNSKYKTEIEQLYLNEISKGMPDGSFGPSRNILRSEVVELFNNMYKK